MSQPGGQWTIETLHEHYLMLRAADERLATERDRRYAEVNVEKEKALKIKETADLAALQLAREIQQYKDSKANELREQISSERGLYATKEDLAALADKFDTAFKPVIEFMAGQQGRSGGQNAFYGWLIGAASLVVSVVVMIVLLRH